MKKTYQVIATLLQVIENCRKSGDAEWLEKHRDIILEIMQNTAPFGSGIDSGTQIDLDASHGDKLVFKTSYHHVNDRGMYDGWTDHRIIVTPSLAFGYSLKVTGRDRNDIKDYLADVYGEWLREEIAD